MIAGVPLFSGTVPERKQANCIRDVLAITEAAQDVDSVLEVCSGSRKEKGSGTGFGAAQETGSSGKRQTLKCVSLTASRTQLMCRCWERLTSLPFVMSNTFPLFHVQAHKKYCLSLRLYCSYWQRIRSAPGGILFPSVFRSSNHSQKPPTRLFMFWVIGQIKEYWIHLPPTDMGGRSLADVSWQGFTELHWSAPADNSFVSNVNLSLTFGYDSLRQGLQKEWEKWVNVKVRVITSFKRQIMWRNGWELQQRSDSFFGTQTQ